MEPQKLVNDVITRAKNTNFGLDEEPKTSLIINQTYGRGTEENGSDVIAMTLVNAFEGKYSLIAIVQALIDVMDKERRIETRKLEIKTNSSHKFCPDCRDKVKQEPCLRCRVQMLERKIRGIERATGQRIL